VTPAKKYYAIARGRTTGIFSAWFGAGNAEEQVQGFAGARYKGFTDITEARVWLREQQSSTDKKQSARKPRQARKADHPAVEISAHDTEFIIYTDGGCSCNPGPGGYGAVIIFGGKRHEISGGFKHTTNNRMELKACIEALKYVPTGSSAIVHSDSQYVVNGISKGWAARWRAKGWMRTTTDAAENFDLWKELLEMCEERTVRFVWVKGHAGNPENECCDQLATQAAAGRQLSHDSNYESGRTTVTG
jgi:ribonuclease HI